MKNLNKNVFITLGGYKVGTKPQSNVLEGNLDQISKFSGTNNAIGIIYDFEGWLSGKNPSNFKPYTHLNDKYPNLIHIACPSGDKINNPPVMTPQIKPTDGYDYIAPMLYEDTDSYQESGGWTLPIIQSNLESLKTLGWNKKRIILTVQVESIMTQDDDNCNKIIDWLNENKGDYAGIMGWLNAEEPEMNTKFFSKFE